MKFNCKDKYNIKFSKSGVSFQLKGINDYTKRIFVNMKNLLNIMEDAK